MIREIDQRLFGYAMLLGCAAFWTMVLWAAFNNLIGLFG